MQTTDRVRFLEAKVSTLTAEVEELRQVVRPLQPYHAKHNTWGSRSAIEKATRLLRAQYEKARCDDEGVSCCVRCNAMFLVRKVEEMVATLTKGEGTER